MGITDVAARAGVSVTTVSHVLSAHRPVAEATRRRVQQVIEELGYQPNQLARSMRTQRTNTVGLIVPDITNPFYPAVARGVLDVLSPAGYQQLIGNFDGDRKTVRALVGDMVTRRVDGLALCGQFPALVDELRPAVRAGIAVAHLGGKKRTAGIDTLTADHAEGMSLLVRHLVERGRRRIGFVGQPLGGGPSHERLAGYRAALAEAGLPADPELVAPTPSGRAGGAAGAAALLDLPRRPDAVVCLNDITAIGVLDHARQRGARVPDDLAVAGFDDIEAASLVSPALTTVAQPARELGRELANLLLRRMAGGADTPQRQLTVPVRLVVRETT